MQHRRNARTHNARRGSAVTAPIIVYGKPVPQGSMRAFKHKITGAVCTTSDNKKLKPWRQQITGTAIAALAERGEQMHAQHVPVGLELHFYLERPKSAPKSRTRPAVKPDLDKLVRAVKDALKGVAYEDDGQVCQLAAAKFYGSPERTEIRIIRLEEL